MKRNYLVYTLCCFCFGLVLALPGSCFSADSLTKAAREGDNELIAALLAGGANVDEREEDGYTALMLAAIDWNSEGVKTLIKAGANVNAKSRDGTTALMLSAMNWAFDKGVGDTVDILLASGANPNLQDDDGYTALMLAATERDLATVKALIAAGADPNIKSKDGYTALMLAANNKHREVAKALKDKMGAQHEEGPSASEKTAGQVRLMGSTNNSPVE